ncbi:helix-turn-helix domain-containing protein [Corynebacterium mastitidis]|uniref:Helix-turn-helix domain-containing protein n=1 Tax=Corynebacterium mastitidis TaxID=161890 RepID=A0ABU8NZG8_9CORY
MQNDTPSLRETKRRATLRAIEEQATRLVLERGYEDVTVEDICAAAGVSRRTFFNYVESKEIAVLGRPARVPPPGEQESFMRTRHEDLVAAVLDALFDALVASHDVQLLRHRKTIRRNNPSLSYNHLAQSHEVHHAVAQMVQRYVDRHPDQRRLSGPGEHEAHAVVTLASAALQLGMRMWMTENATTAESLRASGHRALRHLRAIQQPATEKE